MAARHTQRVSACTIYARRPSRKTVSRWFRDDGDAQGSFGESKRKSTHRFAHRAHRYMRTASRRAWAALTQVTAGNNFSAARRVEPRGEPVR
eukprot:6478265-Prymnesium_polylepis.1